GRPPPRYSASSYSCSNSPVLHRPIELAQYNAKSFAEACHAAGVTRSMGAVGSSADNAAAESLNASFKRETLQGAQSWHSEREARLAVFGWAHRYNTRRRHSHLGQVSPIDYENSLLPTPATLTHAA
ncbi:integrase core domain-containing protein, partial [Saccharothrix luteola]|uniref:integrase core domain-containing protein n=1 Tax=Saccharothrix luteola TaxID=2893018 RepID=UPI001E4C1DC5